MKQPKRILVVEDEGVVAQFVSDFLKSKGYEVIGTANTGEGAVRMAIEERPDLIVMDIRLKGRMDGIQSVEKIHETLYIPVIYMTAYSELSTIERANRTRHSGFLKKPVRDDDLEIAVSAVLKKEEGHGGNATPSG